MNNNETYEERLESNKVVDEAMRMKGIVMFTFDKNCHKIDISKKEYENIKISVEHYEGRDSEIYEFTLEDLYNNTKGFYELLTAYPTWEEGVTVIRYENEFTFEKFVGDNLEEKVTEVHKEVEEYTTCEKLVSVYKRALA